MLHVERQPQENSPSYGIAHINCSQSQPGKKGKKYYHAKEGEKNITMRKGKKYYHAEVGGEMMTIGRGYSDTR